MNTKTSYYEKVVVVNKQLSPLKEWSDIEKQCAIFLPRFSTESRTTCDMCPKGWGGSNGAGGGGDSDH